MNCLKLQFPDRGHDLIIDKATMDTLLCSENPYLTVARYLKEVQRVLRLGGKYFLITTGSPEKRMLHLKRSHLSFEIETKEVKRMTDDIEVTHYCYICTKAAGSEKAVLNWPSEKKIIYDEEGLDSDYDDGYSDKE